MNDEIVKMIVELADVETEEPEEILILEKQVNLIELYLKVFKNKIREEKMRHGIQL